MQSLKVKGHEFQVLVFKDSFHRRAIQLKNKIIDNLKKLGLTEDDIEIPLEVMAIKKAPASASWFLDHNYLHYSYQNANRFIDNLYVVYKVIELEIDQVLKGSKTEDDFIREFSEDKDVNEQRKEARRTLGLDENERDMSVIDQRYKELAKKYHPDMPTGNNEKFKEINKAHKIIKRELQ